MDSQIEAKDLTTYCGIRAVLEIQREMEQGAPIGDTIPHGVPGSGIYLENCYIVEIVIAVKPNSQIWPVI